MAILVGTGHRPNKLGGYGNDNPYRDWVKDEIRRALSNSSNNHRKFNLVYVGGALGFDLWLAEVCIEKGIPFIAVIPFRGYMERWPDETKKNVRSVLMNAKEVQVLSEASRVSRATASSLLLRRNKVMVGKVAPRYSTDWDSTEFQVNADDCVLACWDESSGGTAHTVSMAKTSGVRVVRIDPRAMPGYSKATAYVAGRVPWQTTVRRK